MEDDILADGLGQIGYPANLRGRVMPQAVEDRAIRIAVELGLNHLPEAVIELTFKPRDLTRAAGRRRGLLAGRVERSGGRQTSWDGPSSAWITTRR
jgi:hypothetical protein